MHPDITVIYYTANKIKDSFAQKVRDQLSIAAKDFPIISVSKKPLDFGLNIIDKGTDVPVTNIYKAILTGAKAAKTKYIALAEDDTLYPAEHFYSYLPPPDAFAYNLCRWNIFSWKKEPFFSLGHRRILATMIAPTELLISALEERFKKYPDAKNIPMQWMGEPGRTLYEEKLGVCPQKAVDFYSYVPPIVFSHPDALGFAFQGTRKRAGMIRALKLPFWGTADEVLNKYYYD